MESDTQDVLKEVFVQVLEDYAFMFSDEIGGNALPSVPGPYIQAGMGFEGPFKGRLIFATPEPFAREVAANVLGLELDDPQVDTGALDALKELLNVTCGNLLTALAGEAPVFDLTVPEITPVEQEDWIEILASPDWVACLVGDWPVLLRVTLEGEAAAEGTETP